MLEQIFYQREYYITILLLTTIGIMGTLMQWGTMRRLVNAAKNVKDLDNHPLIKQMKLGYTNSFKLNYTVKNTKVFIEKYLYRYRVVGMSLLFLEKMSEKTSLLCAMGCLCIYVWNAYKGHEAVHFIYITAITAVAILFQRFAGCVFSVSEKKQYFMLLMQDYFDNVLENRLRNHKKDGKKGTVSEGGKPELPEGYERSLQAEGQNGYGQTATTLAYENDSYPRELKVGERKTQLKNRMHKKGNNLTDEQIVEDIIREFFP